MVTAKAHRLEQVLRVWEDFWLVTSLVVKYHFSPDQRVGLPMYWQDFRHHLKNEVDQLNGIDAARFTIHPKTISTNTFLSEIQVLLASWTQHSRRIFTLTPDLQILLDATSLEGVTFNDVELPFQTFAIALPQPLIDTVGNKHDFIVVSNQYLNKGDPVRTLIIQLINSSFGQYVPLTEEEKRRIRKAEAQKNLPKIRGYYNRYKSRFEKIFPCGSGFGCRYEEIQNAPVLEIAQKIFDKMLQDETRDKVSLGEVDTPFERCSKELNVWHSATRTVVGFCLYLKSLPNNSPHRKPWQKPEPIASVTRPITADAEVCEVESQFALTAEERVAFSEPEGQPTRSFGEKCCHFRRGFWCRPHGLGNDPTAKKTEHRRPTIVRKDKLRPGELPRGAETIVLSSLKV